MPFIVRPKLTYDGRIEDPTQADFGSTNEDHYLMSDMNSYVTIIFTNTNITSSD